MSCSSTQKIRFQLRRANESEWESTNPVLLPGEPAISLDTRQIKIGTGATWRNTDYINLAGGVGSFGTPTTLANLITLTASSKVGTNVNLNANLETDLAVNQAVRFTISQTDSENGRNIIANNIYFVHTAANSGANVIFIKRGTAPGLERY